MGVVIPPWISEDWFQKCPYNYCDHFGDYMELAKACTICRKTLDEENCDLEFMKFFEEAASDYLPNSKKKERETERVVSYFRDSDQGIDNVAEGYSILVGGIMNEVLRLYRHSKTEKKLKYRSFDVLSHSKYYVVVKLKRALFSKKQEARSTISRELADSKTSALFVFMAADRNARAVYRLSSLKKITPFLKDRFLEFSKLSDQMGNLIKKEFFPEYDVDEIEEFGCDGYNKLFPKIPSV